jgi:hypothetical protein
MNTAEYSHVVGVFRERSNAEHAIDKLKRIGIEEDQIQLTEYNLHSAVEISDLSKPETNKRLVLSVEADGKQQEAVGIMMNNGANNTDIPPGTELVHGSIINSNSETANLNAEQPTGESSPDSFFGKNARDPYIP